MCPQKPSEICGGFFPFTTLLLVDLRLLQPAAEVPVDYLDTAEEVDGPSSAACLGMSRPRMPPAAEGKMHLGADCRGVYVDQPALQVPLGPAVTLTSRL